MKLSAFVLFNRFFPPDVCASTGVATAADTAKMIRDGLSAWMDRKSYATIDAFRGKLSAKNAKDRAEARKG